MQHAYTFKNRLALIGALAAVSTLTACGGVNSIITNVKMSTYVDANSNAHASLTADVNTGSLVFPAITIPVLDPKHPGQTFGSITLRSGLNGGPNQIGLDVDLTATAHLPVTQCEKLPNGQPIPVAGSENLLCLKAGAFSIVYVALGQNSKMMGLALAIKEFDGISKVVPNVNLFLPFGKVGAINGVAGVFTGTTTGQNGVGLFIDFSSVKVAGSLVISKVGKSAVKFDADDINHLTSGQKKLQSKVVEMSTASRDTIVTIEE